MIQSYSHWLACPDLCFSPGLLWSSLPAVMLTALSSGISHLQVHCADNGLLPWRWTHMEIGAFSWRRAGFPPWPQQTGFYWITFSGPDSSSLHANGFLPESLTVILPPLTHDCEGFVKLYTRHREWLTQSR